MNKKREILKAEVREILGRKVRKLRREGWLPASVYGKGFKSVSLKLKEKEVNKLFNELGTTTLFDVDLNDKKIPVLFKNPQYHPVSDKLIHIDLYKVDLSHKIVAEIPIELIGESTAVKGGGVLVPIADTVEVEALPVDLPEKIEIDISKLEKIGDILTIADLEWKDDKVSMVSDSEQAIVKVEEEKEEVVEVAEETTEELVDGEKKKENKEEQTEEKETKKD
ncbi:50S ribosomal protein L25 [Candidatus Shapirobacteria bacterium]|nr:MAG: 50S ribosomal protein L25 [Candidatus Shapirobacteria bacterium]